MANTLLTWRGGVEPAETSPSGNEIALWRGGVEPLAVTTPVYNLVATAIESASEVGAPVLDTNAAPVYNLVATAIESLSEVGAPILNTSYTRVVRLFRLTGKTGEEN